MLFSNQKWFCNVCGVEQNSPIDANKWLGAMCCGPACSREFGWRQTLSNLGKDYYPDPEPYKETK